MKLLFDEMLKRLSNWCRIFGIYSEYFKDKNDSELLEHAQEKKMIFVTRDVQLASRCKKYDVKCVFIESDNLEDQLVQLIKETGVEITFHEEMRCASCNGELEKIEKEKAEGKVPEDVFKSKELWQCRSCGKLFWQGGHWKNITRIYENIKKRL